MEGLHRRVAVDADTAGVAVGLERLPFTFARPILKHIEILEKDFRPAVGVHLGRDDLGAVRQKRAVQHRPAHDEHVVRGIARDGGEQLGERADEDAVLPLRAVRPEHDVDAVFERPAAGEGEQRVAAHHDDFARRRLAEVLHVCGQAEEKVVVFADAPLFVDGYDRAHLVPPCSLCV